MKQVFAVLGFWLAAAAAQADVRLQGELQVAAATSATTGKERLGDKASDNQRVNDCRVPPEKRGPVRRPAECAQQ
jgi:hypothetical protein